jgi:hypothetical protein
MFSDDGLGDVDMFGLDEFGEPVGMKSYWGSAIGGVAATGTAIAVRALSKSPTMLKHAEGIGLAAGVIAGGAMMAMKGTRHAGWSAIAATLATSGLRYAEQLFMTPPLLGAVEIERTGVIRPLQGDIDVRTMDGGMGIATIEPTGAVFSGGLGDGMPRLLGNTPHNQREATAQLLGVPGLGGPLAAMASSFGATLFGGR